MGSSKFGISDVLGFTVTNEKGDVLLESKNESTSIPTINTMSRHDLIKIKIRSGSEFEIVVFVDEENYNKLIQYNSNNNTK